MKSKICPNCGTKLSKETKFCTNCGATLKSNNKQINTKINDEVSLVEDSLNQPNKGRRLSIAIIGILVLTVLFFIGNFFLKDVDPLEKPFSPIDELAKLEGKWYDPTGIILGEIILLKVKMKMVCSKPK